MLKRVTIENFRSCRSTTLDFASNISALVGPNGVGKTNILQCLDWMALSARSSNPVTASRTRGGSEVLQPTTVVWEIECDGRAYEFTVAVPFLLPEFGAGDYREELNIRDRNAEPRLLFERVNEEIAIAGRPEPIRTGRLTPALSVLHALLPAEDPLRDHLSFLLRFFAGVRYDTLEDDPVDDVPFVRRQAYLDWRMRHQQGVNPGRSVTLRLIHMWNEDRELFEEAKTLLGPDGLGILEDLDINERPMGLYSGQEGEHAYFLSCKPARGMGGAGGWFFYSLLSAGTRRMIRMVTSLVFDQRSLMLIEHPEDSIHFGLLYKLIDLFRVSAYDSQMIFSTHSAEVLDWLRPEEVLLATAEDGNTAVRRLSETETDEAKRFLQDEGTLSDYLETLAD